ncbi:MAG: rhombotarget lipoprotein [Campylobacterales bacterium]|jgi:rhombotail lipoprotein
MERKLLQQMTGFLLSLFILVLLDGCTFMTQERHHSSSVVKYLYPKKQVAVKPQVPTLALPLNVGIAFVPASDWKGRQPTEDEKQALLEEVASHFRAYDFVKKIEIIPSAYLRPEGSFANLDQIRTMFGVDVIALVSYDQYQFTGEGVASLSYWTIVGAYIIPGEKNDTHTMVDAAVYDIASRKLLFRAPGVSHIKGRSTLVNINEQLRKDRVEGFQIASRDLAKNLDEELAKFKEKVKQSPESYKVVHKEGYTGGGSVDSLVLMLMAFAGGAGWMVARRRRS